MKRTEKLVTALEPGDVLYGDAGERIGQVLDMTQRESDPWVNVRIQLTDGRDVERVYGRCMRFDVQPWR